MHPPSAQSSQALCPPELLTLETAPMITNYAGSSIVEVQFQLIKKALGGSKLLCDILSKNGVQLWDFERH